MEKGQKKGEKSILEAEKAAEGCRKVDASK